MRSLILISHSDLLARGVAELAQQMAPGADIVPVGGTDDGGLGTSFDRALSAAQDANGAVVLYDLGSARVVAELVADMVDGVEVRHDDIVEGAITIALELVRESRESTSDFNGSGENREGSADLDCRTSQPIAVVLPNDLHARPAARLATYCAERGGTTLIDGVDAADFVAVGIADFRAGSSVIVTGDNAEDIARWLKNMRD